MFSYRIDEHLELRLLEERHAAELYALIEQNRMYLREWMPWLDNNNTVADTQEFIKSRLKRFAENNGLQVSIVYRNQLAGQIGFHSIDWLNRKTEIGYWLGAAFQGKGLMTKACRALISYAFDELGLNRVEIRCATENKRSRAIPERLGFTQEGIVREAEWLYDHYVDLIVYAVLAWQWHDIIKS